MIRFRLAFQYRFHLIKEYQPNPFARNDQDSFSGRACRDRYDAFSSFLPNENMSFMDLGCNTGYFVFRLAECGGFGLGIDSGRNEIMVCQALSYLYHIKNVSFSRFMLSPDNVFVLPAFDIILCMSIFHHFVRYYGYKLAMNMLAEIARKTNRFLVFETGQPDEKSAWAKDLTFMGNDPRAWGEDMLLSLGFDKVYGLGRFPTSISEVSRHLMIAEKTGSQNRCHECSSDNFRLSA